MAYNPYSKGTDFGFALRNTLNNLLAHKQGQAQANKEQQRYDEEQARIARKEEFERKKEERANDAEMRRLAVLERPEKPTAEPTSITEAKEYARANGVSLGEAMNITMKIKPEETPAQIEESAFRKARGERRGAPPQPREPNAYEMRKADIKTAVERGEITQEEGTKLLIGVAKDSSDLWKKASVRRGNEAFVGTTLDALIAGDIKKYIGKAKDDIKASGGFPPYTTEGFRRDMPRKYNVAVKNIDEDAADLSDWDTKDQYEEMYTTFIKQILPSFKHFKDFMNSKEKLAVDIKADNLYDKGELAKWFKLYGED
jgi:hypothetical protein